MCASTVQGLVPEFVNPKYADAAKSKFKKPTRLECMMQDHPKASAVRMTAAVNCMAESAALHSLPLHR